MRTDLAAAHHRGARGDARGRRQHPRLPGRRRHRHGRHDHRHADRRPIASTVVPREQGRSSVDGAPRAARPASPSPWPTRLGLDGRHYRVIVAVADPGRDHGAGSLPRVRLHRRRRAGRPPRGGDGLRHRRRRCARSTGCATRCADLAASRPRPSSRSRRAATSWPVSPRRSTTCSSGCEAPTLPPGLRGRRRPRAAQPARDDPQSCSTGSPRTARSTSAEVVACRASREVDRLSILVDDLLVLASADEERSVPIAGPTSTSTTSSLAEAARCAPAGCRSRCRRARPGHGRPPPPRTGGAQPARERRAAQGGPGADGSDHRRNDGPADRRQRRAARSPRRTATASSAASSASTTPAPATPVAPGWAGDRRRDRQGPRRLVTVARSPPTGGAASRQASAGSLDRVEPVAHPAHRLEGLGVERRVDLAAQVADVDLDDVVGAGVVGVPDVLEDLALALHLPGLAHQVVQQGVLARGELDLACPRG